MSGEHPTRVVKKAIEWTFPKLEQFGSAITVIRKSHHIACLSSYLKRATDQGLFLILTTSDPSVQTVAPYGGIRPLYTPNPLAAGIPTQSDPILIDFSMSCTANGLVNRLYNSEWLAVFFPYHIYKMANMILIIYKMYLILS